MRKAAGDSWQLTHPLRLWVSQRVGSLLWTSIRTPIEHCWPGSKTLPSRAETPVTFEGVRRMTDETVRQKRRYPISSSISKFLSCVAEKRRKVSSTCLFLQAQVRDRSRFPLARVELKRRDSRAPAGCFVILLRVPKCAAVLGIGGHTAVIAPAFEDVYPAHHSRSPEKAGNLCKHPQCRRFIFWALVLFTGNCFG
jgi:hypothetical protein